MEEEQDGFKQTNLNSVKRLKERGHYDKTTVYSIVDEGYLAHVGFIDDSASEKTQSQPIGTQTVLALYQEIFLRTKIQLNKFPTALRDSCFQITDLLRS